MKLKMPENVKNVNSMTGQFLLTLFATTLSIVLTFGAAAIVDHKKKQAEKRQIVMMLMYDMQSTLKMMDECDSCLNSFFDKQVEILAHPEAFEAERIELTQYIPSVDYSITTENIFRSSIETINTISNIIFVEKVSAFYDRRSVYKREVLDEFINTACRAIESYEGLAAFEETARFPFLSQAYHKILMELYEQCKELMDVSEDELQAFADQKNRLFDAAVDSVRNAKVIQAAAENQERITRLKEALEKGKSNHN
jgi:hypothetical protein